MAFMDRIVKFSLNEQEYKQIGRLPKFFNTKEQKGIHEFSLYMWPGYTVQSKCLNDGFFLNIDTCTKFLQMTTVWDRIKGLLDKRWSQDEISKELCPKYDDSQSQSSGQSSIDAKRIVVITNYNSASYQIEKILWENNAKNQKFEWKQRDKATGIVTTENVSVQQYLEKVYKITLAPWEVNLPLLYLTQRD
jgi:hypothetical protein